jgi:hypothetical protein
VKLPRFRIGDLMVFAVVVAADIAAGRAVVYSESYAASYWLAATMPMAIVLQCTVLWLHSGRRGSYTFWIAALVSGTLALGSVVWNLADPPSETTTISSISGISREIYRGGLAARIWGPYQSAVYTSLESVGLLVDPPNRWAQTVTDGVVYFVPQVLAAISVGLIAEMIHRRLRGPAGIFRSDDRSPMWPKQVASIATVLVIAMIASGMPGWIRKEDHHRTELPTLPYMVDDLKFFSPPSQSESPKEYR